MRQGDVWNSLHLGFLEDSKVGLPSMQHERWITVGAQITWALITTDNAIEHVAYGGSVECSGMDSEPDDSLGILIPDNDHPVGREDQRFTSEQIHVPQTVFTVAQECEPGCPFVGGTTFFEYFSDPRDKQRNGFVVVNITNHREPKTDITSVFLSAGTQQAAAILLHHALPNRSTSLSRIPRTTIYAYATSLPIHRVTLSSRRPTRHRQRCRG